MIEQKNPLDIDISGWLNKDGSLNVQKMQSDIKKELVKEQQKQAPVRRPTTKNLFIKYDRKKDIISPAVETSRPNPIIERIKQVRL